MEIFIVDACDPYSQISSIIGSQTKTAKVKSDPRHSLFATKGLDVSYQCHEVITCKCRLQKYSWLQLLSQAKKQMNKQNWLSRVGHL